MVRILPCLTGKWIPAALLAFFCTQVVKANGANAPVSFGSSASVGSQLKSDSEVGVSALSVDFVEPGYQVHANLICRITNAMSTGIEYVWGGCENVNGDSDDASRVLTLMYTFQPHGLTRNQARKPIP